MSKKKIQGIVFGVIMSYSMALGMEIYNVAINQGINLNFGGFSNMTYLVLRAISEYVLYGFVCYSFF